MAVQPVHHTREEFLTEVLGERVPVARAGSFTLYARSKSRTTLYIHDKRNGPESLPVASMSEQWGRWSVAHRRVTLSDSDPVHLFSQWVQIVSKAAENSS